MAIPPPGDWVRKIDWGTLVAEKGTPRYVYNLSVIRERARRVLTEFNYRPRRVLYSLKANSNPRILEEFKRMGLGAETVSLGEVRQALETGFSPDEISYTACCVTREELEKVARHGVGINADSARQARLLYRLGYSNLGLRINPLVGAGHHRHTVTGGEATKFGLLPREAELLAGELGPRFAKAVKRIHFHAGSGIWDPSIYSRALENVLSLAQVYPNIEEIDIGGGMAYDYERGMREFDFRRLATMVKQVLEKHGLDNQRIIIEPGRYLVAPAGVLMTQVTDVKERAGKLVVGVDTGMNHLIRPILYGAQHRVFFPTRAPPRESVRGMIVGNVCEQGDVLVPETLLPPTLEPGVPLLILDTGAYGESMSSQYNSRPLKESLFLIV